LAKFNVDMYKYYTADVSTLDLLVCDAMWRCGDSTDLRIFGILPQHNTSQPRRPRLESSPPWKPQISQHL